MKKIYHGSRAKLEIGQTLSPKQGLLFGTTEYSYAFYGKALDYNGRNFDSLTDSKRTYVLFDKIIPGYVYVLEPQVFELSETQSFPGVDFYDSKHDAKILERIEVNEQELAKTSDSEVRIIKNSKFKQAKKFMQWRIEKAMDNYQFAGKPKSQKDEAKLRKVIERYTDKIEK